MTSEDAIKHGGGLTFEFLNVEAGGPEFESGASLGDIHQCEAENRGVQKIVALCG